MKNLIFRWFENGKDGDQNYDGMMNTFVDFCCHKTLRSYNL